MGFDTSSLIPNFSGLLSAIATVFLRGGWAVFVVGGLYVMYQLYLGEIATQWHHSLDWVFLNIKVPKENLTSTLAVEAVFGQMHAIHAGLTFQEVYAEGKSQLWFSLELISLGGKISFVIRAPKSAKDLVEASVYAQYPNAEITEVDDYLKNVSYTPDGEFELWGTEYKLLEDDVIPIKTYRDFEHPAAEEKIIEPLAPLFEALAKMDPWEFYGVQLIIQPLGDNEWKPRGEAKVRELIGEKEEHHQTFLGALLSPITAFGSFSLKDALLGGGHGHAEEGNKQKNDIMSLTEMQKLRVTLIEHKIAKPGYRCKLRHMYMAPKDRYNSSKKALVIGAYRPLGSAMTNQFKPDTKNTWTSAKYNYSPQLERALYWDREERRRKRLMFNGYKERDIHLGNPMFILNTEELATLYHFPLTSATVGVGASIDKIESKKSQAPANLPIAEVS